MLQLPLVLQHSEISAVFLGEKNDFLISVKQIKMNMKKSQLEEVLRSF